MKERPILFNAPMVRALLAGRKTQTRRPAIKSSDPKRVVLCDFDAAEAKIELENTYNGNRSWKQCPYGQPGDRLWVRESFRFLDTFDTDSPATVADRCVNAGYEKPWAPVKFEATGDTYNWQSVGSSHVNPVAGKLRPSLHMPRWAARILLEIVSVRVERLGDISTADAKAEGITPNEVRQMWLFGASAGERAAIYRRAAVEPFRVLWESTGGEWATNPWVWVVEFKKVTP